MNGFLHVKLQLGCLLIVLYIAFVYWKQTSRERMSCNKIFDYILAVTPWAIFFDGASAFTVNYRDVVPEWLNLFLHLMFFVTMNIAIMGVFAYIVDLTVGLPRKKNRRILMFVPGGLAMIAVVAFMGKLYYIDGDITSYSMGISPYICFATAGLHFIAIAILTIVKHRYIEKRKKICVFAYTLVALGVLVAQILLPQILFTSFAPTLLVLGIYDNFEDPSRRRLKDYNEHMVTGFATLVENRDDNTGGHIQRTREYVDIILKEMKRKSLYSDRLTVDFMEKVRNAAPLHDIGKISTPDSILQKPGKLSNDEWEIMKMHSSVGAEIIAKTFKDLNDPEYLQIAYDVAKYHHEKWNGTGYPEGLKGDEIPLSARIMAVADVFDAVSADRVYRPAMPLEECFRIIEKGAGVDFDPEIAKLFLNARGKVEKLYYGEKQNSHTSSYNSQKIV